MVVLASVLVKLRSTKAIRKAVEDAKEEFGEGTSRLAQQFLTVLSEFSGAKKSIAKPAVEGSGVAAGGAVRAVIELAGVADVV